MAVVLQQWFKRCQAPTLRSRLFPPSGYTRYSLCRGSLGPVSYAVQPSHCVADRPIMPSGLCLIFLWHTESGGIWDQRRKMDWDVLTSRLVGSESTPGLSSPVIGFTVKCRRLVTSQADPFLPPIRARIGDVSSFAAAHFFSGGQAGA